MTLSNITTSTEPKPAVIATNGVTIISDREASVIDIGGRKIVVKKLSAINRMKLFKAVGPDGAENGKYLSYAALAASVTSIGDEPPMPFPTSALQLESVITRLDDDGLEAVAKALVALTSEDGGVAEAAKNL